MQNMQKHVKHAKVRTISRNYNKLKKTYCQKLKIVRTYKTYIKILQKLKNMQQMYNTHIKYVKS